MIFNSKALGASAALLVLPFVFLAGSGNALGAEARFVEGEFASEAEREAWATPWSELVGVTLEYTFDSDGPDAWDPTEHPLVFITTEGPGYGGLLSGVRISRCSTSGAMWKISVRAASRRLTFPRRSSPSSSSGDDAPGANPARSALPGAAARGLL